MNGNKNNRKITSIFSLIVPFIVVIMLFSFFDNIYNRKERITINEFISHIEKEEVKSIKSVGQNLNGVLKKDGETFTTFIPNEMLLTFYNDYLKKPVESGQITYISEPDPGDPWYENLLPILMELLLLFAFFSFMFRRMQGGNGATDFGKNKAVLYKKDTKIRFADVAGLKEEKEELWEVVDFLKRPGKYVQMGARIPKGVLLVGPPGTGKTYLSMAVAGEAGVPFYTISGSDFVEMFVGVGASRVRNLFAEAKKNSPAIVFIDEIDAVGRQRGTGMGGGHDEREQTLNQLLVEMDGFSKNEGVIVMAATNRADVLDPAILRPGRFDRRVHINYPDIRERREVLEVHTKNKKLAADIDLDRIAKTTSGFTPADLENVTNEAALMAARENKTEITNEMMYEATIKVVAGPEKKSRVVIEKERILTAYHESGHAIVTKSLPGTDPVSLITIVPRGDAGGFTAFIPEEDKSFNTKRLMEYDLISYLGGRAAEELVLDDISTGASNDIERATKLARSMVVTYGMSEKMGPVKYEDSSEDVFLGRTLGKGTSLSNEFANEIDEEVRDLMKKSYSMAKDILKKNMELLHKLSEILLDEETIDKERFDALFDEYGYKGEII